MTIEEVEMNDKRKRGICYYNDGVDCDSRNCCKCGWNPAVNERRKKEIREQIIFEARLQSAMRRGVNVK